MDIYSQDVSAGYVGTNNNQSMQGKIDVNSGEHGIFNQSNEFRALTTVNHGYGYGTLHSTRQHGEKIGKEKSTKFYYCIL